MNLGSGKVRLKRASRLDKREQAIFSQIKAIRDKIDNICDNITDIKVQAAKNAGIYGGGSGAGAFLILTLTKVLITRKNGKRKNDKP